MYTDVPCCRSPASNATTRASSRMPPSRATPPQGPVATALSVLNTHPLPLHHNTEEVHQLPGVSAPCSPTTRIRHARGPAQPRQAVAGQVRHQPPQLRNTCIQYHGVHQRRVPL
ncbi:hypothetical protein Vafri_15204 [Volvox africanus]|uniref:Uncharacterized protein n=1 Tax=Volvox africanus TaxID=51714 RepID=A0A8J4BFS3_9CHLO|nr:hypothetical protein Vafri_15204 [Volvox africanus]